jgi:hypothetical protein
VDPRGSHRGVSPARFAAGRRPRRRRSRWLRLPPASSSATNLARRYIHVTSASAHYPAGWTAHQGPGSQPAVSGDPGRIWTPRVGETSSIARKEAS